MSIRIATAPSRQGGRVVVIGDTVKAYGIKSCQPFTRVIAGIAAKKSIDAGIWRDYRPVAGVIKASSYWVRSPHHEVYEYEVPTDYGIAVISAERGHQWWQRDRVARYIPKVRRIYIVMAEATEAQKDFDAKVAHIHPMKRHPLLVAIPYTVRGPEGA